MTIEAAKRANVLFVDDEPRVLSSMRALFRRDYNVHLANSGNEALELIEQADMDVIVSDQRMPGMTGVDVLKACRQHAPRAMRILLTGYADKDAITASINEGEVFRYLTKPCARDTLRETVALAVTAAGVEPALGRNGPAGPAAAPAARPVTPPGAGSPAPTTPRAGGFRLPGFPGAASPGAQPAADHGVELLVMSGDDEFTAALEQALGTGYRLHLVEGVKDAVAALEAHPIGVLITDIAVNTDEVQALTAELKHYVPELVTIVASDHSDAHRLIDLINGGQVFRFLLKPIRPRQTSIWIDSAIGKHVELLANPNLAARHAVKAPERSLLGIGEGWFRNVASRFLRLGTSTGKGGDSP